MGGSGCMFIPHELLIILVISLVDVLPLFWIGTGYLCLNIPLVYWYLTSYQDYRSHVLIIMVLLIYHSPTQPTLSIYYPNRRVSIALVGPSPSATSCLSFIHHRRCCYESQGRMEPIYHVMHVPSRMVMICYAHLICQLKLMIVIYSWHVLRYSWLVIEH